MKVRKGFTLLEVGVVMSVVAVGAGVLSQGVLAEARRKARETKDSVQVKQMHASLLVKSADSAEGNLLLPGEINRVGAIVGRGRQDELKNDHASLHAAAFALNVYSPALVVSPLEASKRVKVCTDYDYTQYNPAADTFWDGDVSNADGPKAGGKGHFHADLASLSNVSFGTLTLLPTAKGAAFPARREAQWWRSGNDQFVLLGTRGPRDGATSGSDFVDSLSLKMLGADDAKAPVWSGNLVFADNHVERRQGFELEPKAPKSADERLKKAKPAPAKDNLFRRDDVADDADMLLTVTKSMSGSLSGDAWKVEPQNSWD